MSAINVTLGSGSVQRGEMLLSSGISLITYRFLEAHEMEAQQSQANQKKKRR